MKKAAKVSLIIRQLKNGWFQVIFAYKVKRGEVRPTRNYYDLPTLLGFLQDYYK